MRRPFFERVMFIDEPLIGGRQLRYQCLDCGQQVGGGQPHALASPDTPDIDVDRLRRVNERREQEREERWRQFEEQREGDKQRWWSQYTEYLGTTAWRDRRELVLRRANGICENCLDAKAAQVHHTTYAHVGREHLWELRAVCQGCHELIHEETSN